MSVDNVYTKVLLHFDGTDGSTTFTDESGKTWTAAVNAQLDTAQKVFGTASLYLDGSSYITTLDSADFTLDGDFTIDLRFRTSTVSATQMLLSHYTNDTSRWMFAIINATTIYFYADTTIYLFNEALSLSADTWYHVAFVRSGSTITCYLDGTSIGSITYAGALDKTGDPTIGARYVTGAYGLPFTGWIDEVRIIKGLAVWTANFTPPTQAYAVAEINATINIGAAIGMGGTMMKGLAGDMEGVISLPLTIGGTILFTEPIEISGGISLPLTVSGTVNAPTHYECWGSWFELPMLTVYGTGLNTESGDAYFDFTVITLEGTGYDSPVGTGAFDMTTMSVSALGEDETLGTASITWPKIKIEATNLISSAGDASFEFPLISVSAIGIDGAVGTFNKSLPMLELENVSLDETIGTGEISLPLLTLLGESLPTTAYLSMVMNLKNRALTLYDNYDFNSMCRFKGKHFGATKTEIFDLDTGTNDDGTLIDWNFETALVDTWKSDKKLRQAWLSYKSSGDIVVVVKTAAGEEYEYPVTGIDETETGIRVKFGKGITDKYLSLNFKNVDGSSIELDNLQLIIMD